MTKKMRKLLAVVLAIMTLATCLLAGCGGKSEEGKKDDGKKDEPKTSSIGDIPWISLEGWEFHTADVVDWEYEPVGPGYGTANEVVVEKNANQENWDVGKGVRQNVYKNVTMEMYEDLISQLKENGYLVYSEGNINQETYYTLLTHDSYVYNISYFSKNGLAYVTASAERPLSPYLLQDNTSTQSEAIDGMDTKLTMLNFQEGGGDNYIIQLKNGHFILFDGGSHHMFRTMFDFMKANVPEGEKPVVEAWFVTHGHYDHVAWTAAITGGYSETNGLFTLGEVANDIVVNGIYFSQTNDQIIENTIYGWRSDGYRNKNQNNWPYTIDEAAKELCTEDGTTTPVYRQQAGHTYYFKDLTIEIPYCQEQLTFGEYQMDINASSSWHVIYAEDKVFLDAGDTENVNMEYVLDAYSSNYAVFSGNVDIMSAFHHGHNIYSDLIDDFNAPIVFYTSSEMFKWASQYTEANKKMLEKYVDNYYCYGEGAYQYNFATGTVTELK